MITLDVWVSKKVEAEIIAQGEIGVELIVIQYKTDVSGQIVAKANESTDWKNLEGEVAMKKNSCAIWEKHCAEEISSRNKQGVP